MSSMAKFVGPMIDPLNVTGIDKSKGPKKEKIPQEVAPPLSKPEESEIDDAAAAEEERAKRRRGAGVADTIQTSPLGVVGSAKKTHGRARLLGE